MIKSAMHADCIFMVRLATTQLVAKNCTIVIISKVAFVHYYKSNSGEFSNKISTLDLYLS